MPRRAYFYHLKFELYDSPHLFPLPSKGQREIIWRPPPGTDIFSDTWPSHPSDKTEKQVSEPATKTEPLDDLDIQLDRGTLIDCGAERSSLSNSGQKDQASPEKIQNIAQQHYTSEKSKEIAVKDHRFDEIQIEGIDMDTYRPRRQTSTSIPGNASASNSNHIQGGPANATGVRAQAAKARIENLPSETSTEGVRNTKVGWGIVHLYRDREQTPGLVSNFAPRAETSELVIATSSLASGRNRSDTSKDKGSETEEDTTVLCIPAVPSYMTPSDFLGWVGPQTCEQVSHFRLVMTGQQNRYLVLMKFRDAAVARKWRSDWDGRIFGGLEPENCHVLFIKSIVFETPSAESTGYFPYTNTNIDPFTPSIVNTDNSLTLRPLPPPTAALVELPTCPVCLERMDDTTGLLTIICQHVFHCACLTKWRGSGCPVCRHTQTVPSLTGPFGSSTEQFCRVCNCSEDLWICLICGHVGCGRYKGGHAKNHWAESAHCYALEIDTTHIWDYGEDTWVHRFIKEKGDGKLMELPSSSRGGRYDDDEDLVPRSKLNDMEMSYTRLLAKNSESQQMYYESLITKAVDKASSASKTAEAAAQSASTALAQLSELQDSQSMLQGQVSSLTKDRDRLELSATKAKELAKDMTAKWQEEKKVGEGLMSRVNHMTKLVGDLRTEIRIAKEENLDLKEQNRDLSFFISSSEKVKQVEGELGEEIREGTVSIPESKGRGKGKGKGKQK